MILASKNQDSLTIQVFALNPNGTQKANVVSGTARIYKVLDDWTEDDILEEVDLERQGLSVWRYVWNPDSLDVGEYSIEYRLVDVDDAVIVTGEDLIVRDIAEQSMLSSVHSMMVLSSSDIAIVKKINIGRWKIENDMMIFFDEDSETPLLAFSLKNASGQPTMENVFERLPL